MRQKPHDLLEFLRQSGREDPPPPSLPSDPVQRVEATTPMLVLRRTQVTIVAVAAGLGLILAFLLGLGLGGGSGDAEATAAVTGVWGIRMITFNDTEKGREDAADVIRQLRAMGLDEVTLQRIPSRGDLVVMLGSWLRAPTGNARAKELLSIVQRMRDRGKKRAFPGAAFWRIER